MSQVRALYGELLTHQFELGFSKRDRTGLELRKSMRINTLRLPGKESIVMKRVALGEVMLMHTQRRIAESVRVGEQSLDQFERKQKMPSVA